MNSLIDIEKKELVFNEKKKIFITIDKDNNPWFTGKDAAEILEYKNTDKAIRNHVDIDDKIRYEEIIRPAELAGLTWFEEKTIFINESSLYSLILPSNQKEAKLFKNWVTKYVLPSIKKFGEYKSQKSLEIKNEQIQELKDEVLNLRCYSKNNYFRKERYNLYSHN